MKTAELISLSIPTRDGTFVASYSKAGLAALHFPSGKKPRAAKVVPVHVRSWHRLTIAALESALAGRAPKTLPPLDLFAGTEFQREVWAAMRQIGYGETSSYGKLAGAIGKPGARRAVGNACGANPIPVLVPCHRVLPAHYRLGGFSSDLNWKRKLLAREGVRF
jgi:O-6-methylguanine DNA methyltransferase